MRLRAWVGSRSPEPQDRALLAFFLGDESVLERYGLRCLKFFHSAFSVRSFPLVRYDCGHRLLRAVLKGQSIWLSGYRLGIFTLKSNRIMPNIYYCNSISRSAGMLRAVLSWEDGRSLLKLYSFRYTGLEFPTMAKERTADFAVLRIFEGEPDDHWEAGFYSFDGDIMRIEEAVQARTTPPNMPPFKN
jgi:hypothetical protein